MTTVIDFSLSIETKTKQKSEGAIHNDLYQQEKLYTFSRARMQLLKGTHKKIGSLYVFFPHFVLLSLLNPINIKHQHNWLKHPHQSPPLVPNNEALEFLWNHHKKSISQGNTIAQCINSSIFHWAAVCKENCRKSFPLIGTIGQWRMKNFARPWLCCAYMAPIFPLDDWQTTCVSDSVTIVFLVVWSTAFNVCFRSDCGCSFTSFVVKRLLHIEEHVCLRSPHSMLLNSGYPGIITFVPMIV